MQYHLYIFALVASIGTTVCTDAPRSFVSYELSSGRLGDHILAFTKALYVADFYKIPLIYVPFHHSELFGLHKHPLFVPNKKGMYNRIIRVQPETNFTETRAQDATCFLLNLGSHHGQITHLDSMYTYAAQNKGFDLLVKEMLTPTVAIKTLTLPQDIITVALHVRKGSGTDQPLLCSRSNSAQSRIARYMPATRFRYADQRWPHKFPPDSYYINQLILLSDLLDNRPLYVYLFTDDKNPAQLVEKYKKAINKPNITFDFQTTETAESPLNDYWNMAQFDCLIRAASNFSRIAQLLGNHKIVLSIKNADWINNTIVTTKVGVAIRNQEKDIFISKSLIVDQKERNAKLFAYLQRFARECFAHITAD